MPDTSTSKGAYLGGSSYTNASRFVYLRGGIPATPDSQAAFAFGGGPSTSSKSVYVAGARAVRSFIHVYIGGSMASSIHVHMEGTSVANRYITLTNSNASLSKRFRVVGDQTYDDGTLSKAQTIERTIGGGLDIATGEVYTSWSPNILVRHTEPDSNYGNLADLKTFYTYNNPNGTPSDQITFTDHHGSAHTIVFTGDFRGSVLGAMIEGTEAYTLVQLRFEKVA